MTNPIYVRYDFQKRRYERLHLEDLKPDLYVVSEMFVFQDLVEGFNPEQLPLEIRAAYLEASLRKAMQQ